jgi:hypothetical protein
MLHMLLIFCTNSQFHYVVDVILLQSPEQLLHSLEQLQQHVYLHVQLAPLHEQWRPKAPEEVGKQHGSPNKEC